MNASASTPRLVVTPTPLARVQVAPQARVARLVVARLMVVTPAVVVTSVVVTPAVVVCRHARSL